MKQIVRRRKKKNWEPRSTTTTNAASCRLATDKRSRARATTKNDRRTIRQTGYNGPFLLSLNSNWTTLEFDCHSNKYKIPTAVFGFAFLCRSDWKKCQWHFEWIIIRIIKVAARRATSQEEGRRWIFPLFRLHFQWVLNTNHQSHPVPTSR